MGRGIFSEIILPSRKDFFKRGDRRKNTLQSNLPDSVRQIEPIYWLRDNPKERTGFFVPVRSFARWGLIVYLDICCGQLCSVGQENKVQLAQDNGRLRQKLIPVI